MSVRLTETVLQVEGVQLGRRPFGVSLEKCIAIAIRHSNRSELGGLNAER